MHIGLGFESVPAPATPAMLIPAMGSACSWFAVPLSQTEIQASRVTNADGSVSITTCRADWVKIAALGGGAVLLLVLLMRR